MKGKTGAGIRALRHSPLVELEFWHEHFDFLQHHLQRLDRSGLPGGLVGLLRRRQPIVLHRDAVSGGGYATLGTVISPDLNRLAQMQPNQKARFVAVSLEEGLEARRRYNWQVQRLQHFFLR